MKMLKSWVAAAALLALASGPRAALVSLGDGTVKDTNTNLIWLQDWSLYPLSDVWANQMSWADNLTYAGSSDWMLPEIDDFNALFDAYGNLTLVPAFTTAWGNYYWSATEVTPGSLAWNFSIDTRNQLVNNEYVGSFAVAVRRDAVPEPQTLALTLLALVATAAASRRRTRR